jgi:hypothetical protein
MAQSPKNRYQKIRQTCLSLAGAMIDINRYLDDKYSNTISIEES